MDIIKFTEQFGKLRVAPMDEEVSKMFIALSLNEAKGVAGKPCGDLVAQSFLTQVLARRLASKMCMFTPEAVLFIGMICRTPGDAVMYFAYFQHKLNGDKLTMEWIANHFPIGFPVSEEMDKMWGAQKIGGANFVDTV